MCVDGTREVKSNQKYWSPKVAANKERDAKHAQQLQQQGWTVLSIWECELVSEERLDQLFRALTVASSAKLPGTAELDERARPH
jgi:DNA mismatch endonuclease (patch repair protein)